MPDIVDTTISKHSLVISGHPTSVSLEPVFWHRFRAIAEARGVSVNRLASEIDTGRTGNLSSAIRVFVLAEADTRAASSADR